MKQIDVNITKLTQCKLKLKVTLQKSFVEQIYTNCCLELQKEVQLPGFRKGTVPINLLKAKFPQKLNTKFVQKVITDTLSDIVKTHNIKYLPESLEITSTDLKPDDTSSYEVVLETEPQVKLNHYKGLKLKKEIRRVTQNDIEKTLQQLKENNAIVVVSNKTEITNNDIIPTSVIFCVINYKIFIDGKELKQYEGKNVLISLAEEKLPKGLKEGLVGMKRGDKKDIQVEFPINTPNTDLMGKQAIMKVELIEIKEKKLPEIDNNFAKNLGHQNIEELISDIKHSLQQEFDKETQQKLKNQIYDILLKEHDFPVPEVETEAYYNRLLKSLKQNYIRNGGKEENFNLTKEQQEQLKKKSIDEVKLKYILKKILEEEKIQLSKEELEKEKGKLHILYPGREKEVNEYFEKNFDFIASNILEDKIINLIISYAKIKEVDLTPKV